jgi:hypothetical protein
MLVAVVAELLTQMLPRPVGQVVVEQVGVPVLGLPELHQLEVVAEGAGQVLPQLPLLGMVEPVVLALLLFGMLFLLLIVFNNFLLLQLGHAPQELTV